MHAEPTLKVSAVLGQGPPVAAAVLLAQHLQLRRRAEAKKMLQPEQIPVEADHDHEEYDECSTLSRGLSADDRIRRLSLLMKLARQRFQRKNLRDSEIGIGVDAERRRTTSWRSNPTSNLPREQGERAGPITCPKGIPTPWPPLAAARQLPGNRVERIVR